ncbi:major latex protein 146-like [Vicia villosa]|uniref:major latex protein 146-like n=1 Tax=Vicia villosa TaxID=3911 RepID=UPI00273BE079|nr:major latex protein 146-like [Vicia villosa]
MRVDSLFSYHSIPFTFLLLLYPKMVLKGKLISELGIKAATDKCFKYLATQLHELQNHCERVHHTKLHEGEDWHDTDRVKHWTYVIDGKVHTSYDTLEEIDEKNKKLRYNLFGGDIGEHYKVFKLTIELIDKSDGSGAIKWIIDFEKINENIDPPNGWMDYVTNVTKDLDAHLVKP